MAGGEKRKRRWDTRLLVGCEFITQAGNDRMHRTTNHSMKLQLIGLERRGERGGLEGRERVGLREVFSGLAGEFFGVGGFCLTQGKRTNGEGSPVWD